MRRFVTKFLICLVVLLGVLSAFDYLLTKRLQSSHQREYASWNDIMHGKASADVIIMGNSRAWAQYSPQILDSILHMDTYNIGIDGSPINRQIKKYQLYRRYNKKPKIIIQNIDFCTIGTIEGYERHQYFPYFWNHDFRRTLFPDEHFSLAEKIIPFYRYSHFGIRNLFKQPVNLTKGYHGNEIPWDGSELARKKPFRFSPDSIAVEMFEKYLKVAQEEGVRVFLVFAPVYIEATNKLENLEEMYSFYSSLAEKYSAEIIDFNFDEISLDTTFFYNATHLNRKGAELFSRKLGDELSIKFCEWNY